MWWTSTPPSTSPRFDWSHISRPHTPDLSLCLAQLTPTTRVALKHDDYKLYRILPSKVDPLVCTEVMSLLSKVAVLLLIELDFSTVDFIGWVWPGVADDG